MCIVGSVGVACHIWYATNDEMLLIFGYLVWILDSVRFIFIVVLEYPTSY